MKILHLLLQLVISLLQNYFGTKTRVEFNANCLRQDKITSNHRKMLNIYTVFEISKKNCISSYPTLENYLFGAFTVNEKCWYHKHKYSGYFIGLDKKGFFSQPSGGTGRNEIIFGVDTSSSPHICNKKKYILFLGEGPTKGLQHTLTAEKNVFN